MKLLNDIACILNWVNSNTLIGIWIELNSNSIDKKWDANC
jgi:hypothetical protein